MEAAFGGTDAEGAWVWKDAYEALEAAQVLFLRKFGGGDALARGLGRGDARDADPPRRSGFASQTRRSEESEHFQQFSTPIGTRLCRRRSGGADPGRLRARTVGRHRIAGDLRRAGKSAARLERDRRDARRAARPPVPRRRGHPAQRRADPRPARSGDPAERRADEPALLGLAAMSRAASPKPQCATSARRWRGSPRADGSSRSPATMSVPISRPGARPSCACSRRAASSSPRRSPARPMSATVRPSRRG